MLTAIIDQKSCVKCSLCIEACPFDAILGSVGYEHKVLEDVCIGCKLCLNPCPVDCIEMITKDLDLIEQKQIIKNAKKRRELKIDRLQADPIAKFSNKTDIINELNKILDY